MSEQGLPPGMEAYLAGRLREREEAVRRMHGAMTEREQSLVREAAVLAFVRGFQFCHGNPGAGRDEWPRDSDVLADVLDQSRGFPDLYPHLLALSEPKEGEEP